MKKGIPYTELLRELISIPALSRREEKRADFLEEFLESLGYPVQRMQNNILLSGVKPGKAAFTLLLNSHLDTVAPVDGWESDPFDALSEEGKITGLGSNDAGASVVTLIAAYHSMVEELAPSIHLMLLISAEEEISGANGITSMLPVLEDVDGVIVGEPTGMKPAVAERGLMVLDAELSGVAGHAARKEGINAIYAALKDVEAISRLEFPEVSKWLPEPGAQVTMISAGTGHNVVPDLCKFVVDVRSNDCYGNEDLLARISSVCKGKLTPRSTRLKSSVLDEDHLLMKVVKEMGLEAFGSSTLSDMALIPYPALKMGPGDSARSHTAGEYILESELEQAVEAYCAFLAKLKTMV